MVHHDVLHDDTHGHPFDPDEHVLPDDVTAGMNDAWDVEVHETRPRPGPLPADARHVRDVVLRARRRR